MADFLTAVVTKRTKSFTSPAPESQIVSAQDERPISSPGAALEILKKQPDLASVRNVLRFFKTEHPSLIVPNPLNAGIAHQLINEIVPNFWHVFRDTKDEAKLVQLVQSPTVLGCIITRLRALIDDNHQQKGPGASRDPTQHIEDLFQLLDRSLRDDIVVKVLGDVKKFANSTMQEKLIWGEFIAQTASGRLLSICAEAEDILRKKHLSLSRNWIADGNRYAEWIGRTLASLTTNSAARSEHIVYTVEYCSKALSLGYTNQIVHSLMEHLIQTRTVVQFRPMLHKLKLFEQKKYLNSIMSAVLDGHLPPNVTESNGQLVSTSRQIAGAAKLISELVEGSEALTQHLVAALTEPILPRLDDSLSMRRCLIAVLEQHDEQLHNLLEQSIKLFGDAMYIKHTPIVQQEALAQSLALCCGYVHRTQPMFLRMMAKSSHHTIGMSNRIGSSSLRARFLGIAVGMAISRLIDKPDHQLNFEVEGEEADESSWYERLTKIEDKIGHIDDLIPEGTSAKPMSIVQTPIAKRLSPIKNKAEDIQNGPRIVEVISESESDKDDDLISYQKPDSDPEDDTDDPTAINRNKPTAPVYIRDLIVGLRDQENYERHELCLATAASLIRRKANFGTEVADHLDELASIFTGLQDNLELEGFAQQRQQAMIAVLLAAPAQMARWFSQSFFAGDYSLTQRVAVLTTLGVGARELAGLQDSATEQLVPAAPSFPSKQLPAHLHAIYAELEHQEPAVSRISSAMAREMLSPIASQAAERLTGPSILKVRTFSSRMEVEKKRQKPIPNALAKIVADNFFFPLTGRWWLQVRASQDSVYASKHLLPPFLHTLSLLMNASGSNTLSLPQMTREYWDLLLSVRGLASKDKSTLAAILFGFLMILETNQNKERLATEQGKELMETQEWVKMIFNELGAGSDEDERIRVLAAGVVVRCQEVVEKYQRRLAGVLLEYQ